MTHRVLILGARGMLGHMVEHALASDADFSVRGATRTDFDVDTPSTLDPLLHATDYVINCIGVTARHIDDRDSRSVARAIRVNAEFPHTLAAITTATGTRVIHMSTDGVFSGQSPDPYGEDAIPDARDTYGRTKLLGESAAPHVLNIRCSIIGPSPHKHEGLWEWIAGQPNGATVDGYTNHLWHGITTHQYAEFVRWIITNHRFDSIRTGGHILHYAPNSPLTKTSLITAIAQELHKTLVIRPTMDATSVHRTLTMRKNIATAPAAFADTLHTTTHYSRLAMDHDHASAVSSFFTQPTYLNRNRYTTIALRGIIAAELLGDVHDQRILDAGCGDGSIAYVCAQHAASVTLLDVTSSMLDRARKLWSGNTNVTFINNDVMLFTHQEPFDIVLMLGVLAHMNDVDAVIAKLASFLRDGGRALIQFTDAGSMFGRLCYALETRINRHGYEYQLQKTCSTSIVASVTHHGFRIINEKRYSILFPGMGHLPSRILRWYQLASLRNPWLARHGTEVILLLEKEHKPPNP